MTTYHGLNIANLVGGCARPSAAASLRRVRKPRFYISRARFARTLQCLGDEEDNGEMRKQGVINEGGSKSQTYVYICCQRFIRLKSINIAHDQIPAPT